MSRTIPLLLILPILAAAQTRDSVGFATTAARSQIERDGKSTYRPKFEAVAMPASPSFEFFPGLRLPGQKEAFKRPNPPIQVVRPPVKSNSCFGRATRLSGQNRVPLPPAIMTAWSMGEESSSGLMVEC